MSYFRIWCISGSSGKRCNASWRILRTKTWNREFGSTKVMFDVSMAVIAAVLSFVFAYHLDGVREGTIIAALLVGFIARFFGKKLEFVKPILFAEEYTM